MAKKRVIVKQRIRKAVAPPPAPKSKTMTAGSGQQPATAGNPHPFADIKAL